MNAGHDARGAALMLAAMLGGALLAYGQPAAAQSIWDKLKSKAKSEIEKAVEDRLEKKKKPAQGAGHAETGAAPAGPGDAPEGAPADGVWQGQLVPAGKKSLISYGGLEITLADGTRLLRYQANSDCHGELEGENGIYKVRFISGQSLCGTRASLRLGGDGQVRLTWEDAPGTKSGAESYTGRLTRRTMAFPRKAWSVDAAQRASFDILGFRLGMTYGDALERIRADKDMSHEWRLIASANGKGTLSPVEVVKKGSGKGMAFVGETISLQFEAQSPEEMKVRQDPDILARRDEIDKMAQRRAEEERRIRADFAQRSRTLSRADWDAMRAAREEMERKLAALPPIPEKPPLRPEGADAELLVIARQITFPRDARPHIDNVTAALVAKYGPPSHRLADGRAVEWAFGREGKRIADAAGGPCDVISPAAKQDHSGEVVYYGPPPQFVSPVCGLTLAVELRPQKDGGLYEMRTILFDQQRLLGDNWYRTVRLTTATLEKIRADLEAAKSVKAPKL